MVAAFDGGPITSDAGALLLRQVDQRLSLIDQVADCFTDHRNPDRIRHSLRTSSPSALSPSPWAMKTSTTMTNSATIP